MSKILCIQNLVLVSSSNKDHNYVAILWRMTMYNLNVDLVYDNVYAKLVSISLFVLKILKKTDFLCQSRSDTLLQICKK